MHATPKAGAPATDERERRPMRPKVPPRLGWAAVGLTMLAGVADAAEDAPPPTAPPEAAAPAQAAPGKDWALDFDLTYDSKYVWRGIVVTEDPVLQPSINFACKDLTLNVWANIDTTDVNDFRWQSNEVDFTLDYSFSWKCLNFSVGAVYYDFPQAHTVATTEVYAGVGLDVLTQPTLMVYQDVHEQDGQYLALSFGHTFEDVWKPNDHVSMSVELSTAFGWGSHKHNEFYYGTSGSGWADATVGLALPFAVGDHLTVTPFANYLWILDDGVSSSLGRATAFWAGLSMTFSF